MKKLENKTVFITGALSGIGKACAFAAAKEGANVVLIDLQSVHANDILNKVKQDNKNAIFIPCDVSDYLQVKHAVDQTIREFDTVDIALNNAGIGGVGSKIGDMLESDWQHVVSVNLSGVFNCMKHQLKQMEKQRNGIVINMSSILGKVGFSNSGHYVAAKHGVIGLTQTAALEYAELGIRVNAICPGFIDTPLLEEGGINKNNAVKQAIIGMHPMKRFGKSEEIANGFLFLASSESTFMNGSSLEIDGGFLCQ